MPKISPNPDFADTTNREIEQFVERVARKSGYAGGPTYRQHLQHKMETKVAKTRRKIEDKAHKFGIGRGSTDFAEEIRTYLADGVAELVAEGYSEAEALRLTRQKFDEAELAGTFDEFLGAFDGFGLEDLRTQAFQETQEFYTRHGETIGLFYAAFVVLGLTAGSLIGWLTGHSWQNLGIGAAAGFGFGVAAGLLANAIFSASRRK